MTIRRVASAGAGGQFVRSQIAVTYARVDERDLWVAVVMDESEDIK